MKRVAVFAVVTAVFAGVFFSSCGGNSTAPTPEVTPSSAPGVAMVTLPEELREIVAQNRDAVFPTPVPDLSGILLGYQTSGLEAEKDASIAEIMRQSKAETITVAEQLSHEEIAGELDVLFDLLKYGYAAYQYFGGDDAFGAVKQSMLTELALMENPVSGEAYVNELLVPHLTDLIIDSHFAVGDRGFGAVKRLYLNEEYVINKIGNDFLTEIDGRMYKIININPGMECLLPTLTRDGEFAWAFGFTGEYDLGESKIDVELEDVETKEKMTRTVELPRESREYINSLSEDFYAVKDVNSIKVLENRRLYTSGKNDPQPPFDEFTETGTRLRDEPVLILDMRFHRGGDTTPAVEWIRNYTGQMPSFSTYSTADLQTKTSYEINPGIASSPPVAPKWEQYNYAAPSYIQNDNLLIVLVDNMIASAGEGFVSCLRQLDNVVFVGTNTYGCLVTGNVGRVQLPISGQWIQFGTKLNIRPDLSQIEGIGFMPDLWVPPGESLERVVKFAERYGE